MPVASVNAENAGDRAFWRSPVAGLLSSLGTSRAGLAESEAKARLEQFGQNRFDAGHSRPLLTKITARLLNPLITILIVVAAVSGVSGDLGSSPIIVTVISFS